MQKSPSGHHRTATALSGCIFAIKACIDNWKKNYLDSNTPSTCPHNMTNFGPLTAEIYWRVWGTPSNFNGFHVLAALLLGTLVVGVSQKVCGVEWRAPPTFDRAAITLGICQHCVFFFFFFFCFFTLLYIVLYYIVLPELRINFIVLAYTYTASHNKKASIR